MDYIKFKNRIFINEDVGDPILENSFLSLVKEVDGRWVVVPDKTIYTFTRYIDGVALSGELGFYKNFKVRNKKFKGIG